MEVPPRVKLGNTNFFGSGCPRGRVKWAFEILGFFGYHNLGSTNDRRLVLVSNIMFWDELSEKKFENFFWAPKDHFLAKRGPFWVPKPPSTKKFEISNFLHQFHSNSTSETEKKNLCIDLHEG